MSRNIQECIEDRQVITPPTQAELDFEVATQLEYLEKEIDRLLKLGFEDLASIYAIEKSDLPHSAIRTLRMYQSLGRQF